MSISIYGGPFGPVPHHLAGRIAGLLGDQGRILACGRSTMVIVAWICRDLVGAARLRPGPEDADGTPTPWIIDRMVVTPRGSAAPGISAAIRAMARAISRNLTTESGARPRSPAPPPPGLAALPYFSVPQQPIQVLFL